MKKDLGYVSFDKSKNKWITFYYIQDTITNTKKRARKAFKSQEEAENFLYSINNPTSTSLKPLEDYTLNVILEIIVLKKLENKQITPKHAMDLREFNKQISNYDFSYKFVYDITQTEIQEFLSNLAKEYSDNFVYRVCRQLREAFKFAYESHYINKNPMEKFIRPKSNKKTNTIRPLTENEIILFNQYLIEASIEKLPYKNLFLIMLYMGLSVSEVLALNIYDVDLKKYKLRINKNIGLDEKDSPYIKYEYENSRIIPINKQIENALKEQIKIANKNSNKLLFISKNNTLVNPCTINKTLQRIFKSNFGIIGISTLSIRYYFKENLMNSGFNKNEIRNLIGTINKQ